MTGAATPPSGTRFEVTYPNGASTTFDYEWQAVQAQAISGGVVRPLFPPDVTFGPPPEAAPAGYDQARTRPAGAPPNWNTPQFPTTAASASAPTPGPVFPPTPSPETARA